MRFLQIYGWILLINLNVFVAEISLDFGRSQQLSNCFASPDMSSQSVVGKFRSFYTTIEQVGDRHTVPIMAKFRSLYTTIEQVGDKHTVPIMGKFRSLYTTIEQVGDRHTFPIMGKFRSNSTTPSSR